MKQVYVVIRVPKSGSTSLINSLVTAIAPKNLFLVPGSVGPDGEISFIERGRAIRKRGRQMWRNYKTLSEGAMWDAINNKIADGDVLSGHIYHGALRLRDVSQKLVTIIRDPMGQFISEYKWLNAGWGKRDLLQRIYQHGRIYAAGRSLDYYLDFLCDHQPLFNNPATRFITGTPTQISPFDYLREKYWHYGVLDRPDLFQAGFQDKSGIALELQHLNTTPSSLKVELTNAQYDKYERLFSLDVELYEKTKKYIIEGVEKY